MGLVGHSGFIYFVVALLLVVTLFKLCDGASNEKIIELVHDTVKELLPLQHDKRSPPMKRSPQAIFSCALSDTFIARDAIYFAGIDIVEKIIR